MYGLLGASAVPTAELLMPLLWLFGTATVIVAMLHIKKFPSLLGFLITGVVVGPAGFGVVQDAEAIAIMAEIGIVLLMFTIGLEISLKDLAKMARMVLGGGAFQIAVTSVLFTFIALGAGMSTMSAIALGLVASASSTALVLRLLGDRGELGTQYGRLSLAILLAQDFAVVGLMMVMPMLAKGNVHFLDIGLGLGEGVLVAAGIYLGARFVFPWVLSKVVELRSREVFLLATMAAVFGTGMIAESLGLSLALGAFVAGLVVSESEFSHQMFAEVLPFRDVFNGLFFASVGLLIDPDAIVENFGFLMVLVLAAVVGKFIIVFVTAKLMKLTFAASLVSGVALAQMGEFGLVLAQQAAVLELISATEHSLVIATAVFTMGLTAVVFPAFSDRMKLKRAPDELPALHEPLNDHVIVVGYGLNGRNVARALRQLGVTFVVVELNQTTVVESDEDEAHVVYGDATTPALLEHLNINSARAIVSAIASAPATREIVSNARHANPDLLIIARTRYVAEIEPLRAIGADVVVPEEFETSIELVGRVMRAYGASDAAIQTEKRRLRGERYRHFLDDEVSSLDLVGLDDLLHALEVVRLRVGDGSNVVDKTLGELDFRAQTGSTVVALLRDGETVEAPDATTRLSAGDTLVVLGDSKCIGIATEFVAPNEDAD